MVNDCVDCVACAVDNKKLQDSASGPIFVSIAAIVIPIVTAANVLVVQTQSSLLARQERALASATGTALGRAIQLLHQ
jgi:hypothetical protein